MKLKMFAVLSVALATVALVLTACTNGSADKTPPAGGSQNVLYYTCPMHPSVKADKPGSCPICNMTLQPVYGNAATNPPPAPTTNAAAKPYPLTTCLVDDMKLGSMGDPYLFVYQGQEIKFCCADCKPEFLKNPDKYLKKIADASATSKN